jgi:hypothetical protein
MTRLKVSQLSQTHPEATHSGQFPANLALLKTHRELVYGAVIPF